MSQGFQKFTKRYVNVLWVLIGIAVVSSGLLNSGCGMTGGGGVPRPTPIPDTTTLTSTINFPSSTILAGIANNITGTASDTGGGSVARVEVSVDSGTTFSAATGTTSWSFSFTPTTPGPVTIRSRATDNSGNVRMKTE